MTKKSVGGWLLALAVSASLITPALATENKIETAAAAAIDYAAQYGGATSVQYALWEDGKITATGHTGVYSKSENRALTDDILYGVGSISKIYTTAAVMKLVEEGTVRLDSAVTTYLPDFTMADARYKDITVRMLLNHSSGLMGSTMGDGFLLADPDPVATDDLLRRLSVQSLKADPGAFSVYCNDGFTLVELLIERVSGQTFGDFLQQKLFDPNGLNNTYLPGGTFEQSRLAKIYTAARPEVALPNETVGVVGTGGIYATASDLAAFGGLFCAPGMLSQSSLDATMASEYAKGLWWEDTEDQLSFGLGWDAVKSYPFAYSDIQALTKGGDTLAYHGAVVVLPEHDMAVAVLSSGGVSTYNQMAGAKILTAALAERGVVVDESVRTLPAAQPAAMPKELTSLSGRYGNSTNVMTFTVAEDGKMTDSSGGAYTYYSDGSFRTEDGSTLFKFIKEENGEMYLWQKAYAELPGLGVIPVSAYALMKLAENPVSPAVQQAWDGRNGKLFLSTNQKYSGEAYTIMAPMAGLATDYPGYMVFDKLVDEYNAVGVALIPGTGGRDWQNVTIVEKDNVEYMEVAGGIYIDGTDVKAIYGGAGAYSTIQADGYARWYQVGNLAGKTMAVQMTEVGAFYVYDANGLPVAGSWAWGDTSAILPEGGWIVFAGVPGAQFHLTMS